MAADEQKPPTIPRQRIPKKVPTQPVRNRNMTGIVCCGRAMRRSGQQYVCGKCGGWSDPGVSGAVSPVAVVSAGLGAYR